MKTKRFKLNFFFKLSDLKSNFILTLGYLNPALNNPAPRVPIVLRCGGVIFNIAEKGVDDLNVAFLGASARYM